MFPVTQFKLIGYYSNFNQHHNSNYFNIIYQNSKNHKSKLTLLSSNVVQFLEQTKIAFLLRRFFGGA